VSAAAPHHRRRRPYPTFRGWWIVGVSFLALYLNGSSLSYLFGVFILPMEADLGWTRATLLGGLTATTFVTAGTGLVLGPFVDRHGARGVMTAAAVVSGAVLLALPHVTAIWQYYLLMGVGLGMTKASLENVGPRTAIANWFIKRRASAFAWFSGGRALFGVTAVAPFAYLISQTSWKAGWTVVGAIELVILAPLAWIIVRRRPEDHGQLPDGDTPRPTPGGDVSAVHEEQWTRAEAMRTRTFWLIVVGFALSGFPTSGMIANLLPYFDDRGMTVAAASAAFSVFAAGAMAGRPIWGFVSSRMGVHASLSLYGLMYGATIAWLVVAFSVPALFTAAFLLGVPTGGAAQLQAQAWPDLFGRRSVGAITGVSTLIVTPTMAAGPLLAALAFDLLRSYSLVFLAYAAGAFLSAACFYFAGRPVRSPASSSTSAS